MGTLSFSENRPLFDGDCVRFVGVDDEEQIVCGVTTYALKHCTPGLPHHGLLPAEAFLSAFEKLMEHIHHAARRKYENGGLEAEGAVQVMVHRQDIAP
jgi:hypothetical protein